VCGIPRQKDPAHPPTVGNADVMAVDDGPQDLRV
jgi:hypothetical protein